MLYILLIYINGIVIYIIFFFILALFFKDIVLLPHANKKNRTDKSSDLRIFYHHMQLEILWDH